MTRVVLASASSGRRKVLQQAGIDPLVVVSGVDEDAVIARQAPDAAAGHVVCALAAAKAESVVELLPAEVAADCVVIGCDSMLYIDGRLRGKPGTVDAARRAWQSMAGHSGELFTGHCVLRLRDGAITRHELASDATTVVFAQPDPVELEAYLASGEPLGVAGAFTLDGLGGWFIDDVEGDPSNVVGIGLAITRTLLRKVGLSVADIWRANPLAT